MQTDAQLSLPVNPSLSPTPPDIYTFGLQGTAAITLQRAQFNLTLLDRVYLSSLSLDSSHSQGKVYFKGILTDYVVAYLTFEPLSALSISALA